MELTILMILIFPLLWSMPIILLIRHFAKNGKVIEEINRSGKYAIATVTEIRRFRSKNPRVRDTFAIIVDYEGDDGQIHQGRSLRTNYDTLSVGDKLQIRYMPPDYGFVIYGPKSDQGPFEPVRTLTATDLYYEQH